MSDTNNIVSCIIPTYRRSDSLIRAINSVLSQSYKNIEVIVVDDNEPNDNFSKDVQRKIAGINDSRLIYLQQEKHINGAVARNYGIKNSTGDYIAFLDDDDEWEIDKVLLQKELLDKLDNSYGAVSCLTTLHKDGKKIRTTPEYSEDNLQKKVLEHSVSIFTGTVLFKRACLEQTGFFNEKLLRHQDLQLFADFLADYKIKLLNRSLMKSHIDDPSNRPDTKRLIQIKKNFFLEMEDQLFKYSDKDRKDILASHYFEIIFAALKEKNVLVAMKYGLKIGFNLSAYKQLYVRFKSRKQKNT